MRAPQKAVATPNYSPHTNNNRVSTILVSDGPILFAHQFLAGTRWKALS